MHNLGPHTRVPFAVVWILGQVALILTVGNRPDGSFAFRMFPEASTIEIRLQRETSDGVVPAPQGEWSARDAQQQLRHFSWRERVRNPVLASLDTRTFASYGAEAQLARLQRALDDVADHIPEDNETIRLRATVVLSQNGAEPRTIALQSHARRFP